MTKTLLVDGENLFKIGFHAIDYHYKEKHIGGTFHFINTLRKLLDSDNYDKIVVFWDGENNSAARKKIYQKYKENRKTPMEDFILESFMYQKVRIKQYLEEIFVRQVEVAENEADDLISYYCKISPDEKKTIFSADRDLLQLIDKDVSVYSPNTKMTYKFGDKIKIKQYYIPHYNLTTYKIMLGDKSDNISGVYSLGEKKLMDFFPEILDKPVSYSDILNKSKDLVKENKSNVLKNILSGRTKDGEHGEDLFKINERIIDLSKPLISEEAKKIVELYYKEPLDPDGRGYKGFIKMMTEDGFFKFLPRYNDDWVDFIKPFLKLTRKEKRNFNK